MASVRTSALAHQNSLETAHGHSIVVSQVSCHVDSGPMKGGVLSGADLWEMDNANGDMISGSGVVRQPSGIAMAYKGDRRGKTDAHDDRRQSDRLDGFWEKAVGRSLPAPRQ